MSERILAIETSCDETAAAVVEGGRIVLSSAVYSQIDLHRKYGGVVPELASRNHVEKLPYVVDEAMSRAGLSFSALDAVAVTYAPGLIGALLTGVSYAKALAYAVKKPLIAVDHIEGHICANYISHDDLTPPFVCLVASGGHTHILHVLDYGQYHLLGATRDDACGEAFDKVARVLGLPYPGGPELERLAAAGDENAHPFPRGFKGQTHLDFTFSGLKTAVVNHCHRLDQLGEPYSRAYVAASFQKCVVDVLTRNTFEGANRVGAKKVALAGGVSANSALRAAFTHEGERLGVAVYLPEPRYCTDNAAMIGSAAYFRLSSPASLDLNAAARHELVNVE